MFKGSFFLHIKFRKDLFEQVNFDWAFSLHIEQLKESEPISLPYSADLLFC